MRSQRAHDVKPAPPTAGRPLRVAPILAGLALLLLAAANGRALADGPVQVVVNVVVNVDVLPDHAAEGKALLKEEGRLSRHDAGFITWQLLQRTDRGNHFAIVESWESESAFDRHVESDHAKAARGKLQPLLASPFDERIFTLVE